MPRRSRRQIIGKREERKRAIRQRELTALEDALHEDWCQEGIEPLPDSLTPEGAEEPENSE